MEEDVLAFDSLARVIRQHQLHKILSLFRCLPNFIMEYEYTLFNILQYLHLTLLEEGWGLVEHLIQDDSQTVHIHRFIVMDILHYLRTYILGGTTEGLPRLEGMDTPPKIDYLKDVSTHHDILQLQIPMQYMTLFQIPQRQHQLSHPLSDNRLRHQLLLLPNDVE